MPVPPESNVLAAPTDASEATGTQDVTTPASNSAGFLVYGPPMPKTFACLSYNVGEKEYLSDDQFILECQRTLFYKRGIVVQNFVPTITEYRTFFNSTPNWIFFAGHFTAFTHALGGSVVVEDIKPPGYVIFEEQAVEVHSGQKSAPLIRGSGLELHQGCEVTFWSSCSAAKYRSVVDRLRTVFGEQHLILGFRADTNWFVSFYMMGGLYTTDGGVTTGITSRHFFDRVQVRPDDLELVRDAWLDAALACLSDPGLQQHFISFLENDRDEQGNPRHHHFEVAAAIDPSGQAWGIENGAKVKIKLSGDL